MAMTKEEKTAYMREWRKKNREKVKEADRKYREKHKEQIKETHKKWRDNNREHLRKKAREKYRENPEAHRERVRRYKETHQEEIKASRKRYKQENKDKIAEKERKKRQENPKHRIKTSFICLVNNYLRRREVKSEKTFWEIVGVDFETLLKYLECQFEEGMTFENYGNRKGCWCIDHIIPISVAKTDEDIEKLNHYTNLQPLWFEENSKKGKKIL